MQFILPALALFTTALAQQQCYRRQLPQGYPPQGTITVQFPNGVNPGFGPTACQQVNNYGYVAEINYRSVDFCNYGQRYVVQTCDFPCCKALAAVDGSAGTCVCGL
ncbi:Hypothetical predicted protein [Lecanosticta acicola]|uniref:Uncharacterized protein n=1 Tax=Lecanosticta acicola TaxID=111012 RepID=A0AAI8YYG7_9PEZI|nr:Hypothetical predicted protein [Lecanosticta acicola]